MLHLYSISEFILISVIFFFLFRCNSHCKINEYIKKLTMLQATNTDIQTDISVRLTKWSAARRILKELVVLNVVEKRQSNDDSIITNYYSPKPQIRYVGGGLSTDLEQAPLTISSARGAPATSRTPGATQPAYRSSAVAAANAPTHQHFAFAARKL